MVTTGWHRVTQAFNAFEDAEPPPLAEFGVGQTIYVLKDDGVYIRFKRKPSAREEFYAPRHWFGNVTEPDKKKK